MVFEALLGIFLPIILGYLFQKINYIPSSLAPGLRLFVIRIAIPALVFQNLYSAELSELKQFLPLVLSLFIFTAFAWILAWLLTSIPAFRKRRMENILLIIFSNVGFMGWAVISQLLGPQGLRRGIFFTSLWMVNLYLYSYISYKVCEHDKAGNRLEGFWPSILPVALAVAAALVFNLSGIQIPEILTGFLGQFASMTVPLILFTLGLSVSLSKSFSHWKQLLPVALLRHVIIVVAMFCTLFILPWLDGMSRQVLLVETIMPVGAGVLISGEVFKRDMDYLASGTALSTLLSFITLPLLILFYPH